MKLWAESELKKAEQEQQKARTERVIAIETLPFFLLLLPLPFLQP